MKHQVAVKRWSRRLSRHGNSLYVSLPADLIKQWEIGEGEELVAYQLPEAILVVPFSQVLRKGEPAILKTLTRTLA